MATDYSIRLVGTGTQSDLVINDIISAEVNLTDTAMSDFSATVPKDTDIRQYLQQEIRFEDDFTGEVVWYGTLERWQQGETDIETSLSGRGPLLKEKQSSAVESFTSVFADDALLDFVNTYGTTDFEFVTEDQDVRVKDETITNDGEGSTGTFENQVQIPSNTRTFSEWEVAVKYAEGVTSSTVGISDTSGGADETATLSEDEASDEWIHSELTTASDTGAPYIYVDIDTTSNNIVHLVAYPSDSTQRYITSQDIDGTVLDGMSTLSEIAGYRFGPLNYNNVDTANPTHTLFPIGYEVGEPDWRILDANRSTDFGGYANKVTVRGASKNGSFYSATVQNDDEIAEVGKTIESYDKRVDLESDAECRAVAKSVLASSVQNRGESGSLTVTIPSEKSNVPVGATTPISVYNSTFNDGGMTGPDALHFKQKNTATERIRTNSWIDSTATYSLSANIYAHLDELDRDAYIFSNDYAPEFLVVEPDGTLRATNPVGASTGTTITAEEVIENRTTQEVQVRLDGSEFQIRVDGEIVARTSTNEGYVMDPDGQVFGNRHRDTFREDGFRFWQNSSLIATWDEVSYDGTDFANYADVYNASVTQNTSDWVTLQPSDSAYREGIKTDGSATGPRHAVSDDASVNIGTGDFGIATWVNADRLDAGDEYRLIEKGGTADADEGWMLTLEAGGAVTLYVSDGTTRNSHVITADAVDTQGWFHLGVGIDNTADTIEGYVNGTKTLEEAWSFPSTDISNTNSVSMLSKEQSGGDVAMDETRLWSRLVNAPEIEEMASLGPAYSDVFRGGIDEIDFDDGLNGSTHYFALDDDETPDTAIDSAGTADATIYNVDFAAVSAPAQEITYSFSSDVTASVKFDIAGRVDTELSRVRGDVENIKR